MKWLLLFLLFLPSCALIKKYTHTSTSHKKVTSQKVSQKKQKKSVKSKETSLLKKKKVQQKVMLQAKNRLRSQPLTQKQITQLKKILKSKNNHDLKDPARMLLGRHFFKTSSYKKAVIYYKKVEQNPYRKMALLWLARLYQRLNQAPKALQLIEQITEEEPDLSDRFLKEVYLLKLALISTPPSPSLTEVFKAYCDILTVEHKNKAPYREKAKQILFAMSEKSVLDLKSKDFITPLKDLVFFKVGEILLEREKFRKALSFFKKFGRVAQDSYLEKQALKYIQAIKSRKQVNKYHIGAIVPLTGPSAGIGKKSLQGLKMGLGLYNKQEKTPFKLIAIDSQGQADKAKKAVHTLVTKHNVIAIVGGVLSRTAPSLAKEAQNFAVPALLMSQKSGLTQVGSYVFQNGLTARLIADQLVHFFMDQFNARQFAILYPNDPYGVDYANAFWSVVEAQGGQITGAQFYKPGETDFNGPIRRLTGLYYLTDRTEEYQDNLKNWYLKKGVGRKRGHVPVENILQPIVDFDVLFIPDSLKTLGLIAPHLAYNDIKNINLAGPSLWNNKKVLKKYTKYANQIVSVEIGTQTQTFRQTKFYQEFFKNFNRKPGLFELQAYESALALRQVILSGADGRNELKKQMVSLKKFYGPMGEIAISQEREFERSLKMLTIKKPAS